MSEVDPDVWSTFMACAAGESPWPLVLLGPAGTGKTCAALLMLDHVIDKRRYRDVSTLCACMIEFHDQASSRARSWWQFWSDAAITALDELGSREKVSDHHYEMVKRAIDKRHGKPAVFVSNLRMPELAEVYDDRIASRLSAGTVIEVGGPDRRLQP